MTDIPWTPEDQTAWEASWKTDHMQRGLLKLKLACLPNSTLVIQPGMDLKEIASQSDAFTKGKVSMFAEIEKLKPTIQPKPLPPAFQSPRANPH